MSDLSPAIKNIRSIIAILHRMAPIGYLERSLDKAEREEKRRRKLTIQQEITKKRDEEVIKLREVDGLSFEEISAHFNVKPMSGNGIYKAAKHRQRRITSPSARPDGG